ncbi:MAG: hypothetical protein HOY69_16850, partial [Streptomyces sp.]|nr:hypothetical protein [Streptomyces sp.]
MAAATAAVAAIAVAATLASLRPSGGTATAGHLPPSGGVRHWSAVWLSADATAALASILPAGTNISTMSAVSSAAAGREPRAANYQLLRVGGPAGELRIAEGERTAPTLSCAADASPGNVSCTQTDLPGGERLLVQEFAPEPRRRLAGSPYTVSRTPLYTATLAVPGGRTLLIEDIGSYDSSGPHPDVLVPPLSKAELTAFAQRPELLDGAGHGGR